MRQVGGSGPHDLESSYNLSQLNATPGGGMLLLWLMFRLRLSLLLT